MSDSGSENMSDSGSENMSERGPRNAHIPVMLAEMLAALQPRDGAAYLDGTFGGGGYTTAILEHAKCRVWAIDRDESAIARGAALMTRFPDRLQLLRGRFGEMVSLLSGLRIERLDGVVLDIGVSSFQIDDPARGFSFRAEGPLDMRMGKSSPTKNAPAGNLIEGQVIVGDTTAATLVNTLPERELADLLYELGEERASRRIARAIVIARAEARIETTGRLASIIRSVLPRDASGHDPATRSFQALRISVNDELGELERGLHQAAQLMNPGGRIVVVSFHSLEDRIVKRFMSGIAGRAPSPSRHDPRGLSNAGTARARFRLLTPKAVRPSASETAANPRARSARLRAVECLEALA